MSQTCGLSFIHAYKEGMPFPSTSLISELIPQSTIRISLLAETTITSEESILCLNRAS